MDKVSVAGASGTHKDITSHKLDEKLNDKTKLVCDLHGGKVGLTVNDHIIELYININIIIIQYW